MDYDFSVEKNYNENSTRSRNVSNQRKFLILLSAIFCNFMVEGLCQSFSDLYPNFVEEFKGSGGSSKILLIGSLLPGIYLVICPIICLLLTRFSFCAVTIAGSLLSSIGFIASSFTFNADQLTVCYTLLAGMGFGAIHLSTLVAAVQSFSSYRGTVVGIIFTISGSSTFVFTPVTSFLTSKYGWRGTNQIFGALLLNGIACGLVLLRFESHKRLLATSSRQFWLPKDPRETEPQPYIMKKMAEIRCEERDKSLGSLDGYVITYDNCLVKGSQADCTQQFCEENVRKSSVTQSEIAKQYDDLQRTLSEEVNEWEFQIFETSSTLNYKMSSSSEDQAENFQHGYSRSGHLMCARTALAVTRNISFILINVSFLIFFNAFFFIAMYLPSFIYMKEGGSLYSRRLLNLLWICNSAVRSPVGLMCDKLNTAGVIMYSLSLCGIGVLAILLPWASSYAILVVVTVGFGMFIGALVTLKPILLMDTFGEKRFKHSYALSSLLQGISTMFAPLAARLIPRRAGLHSVVFVVAGVSILTGAVISLPLKWTIDSHVERNAYEKQNNRLAKVFSNEK